METDRRDAIITKEYGNAGFLSLIIEVCIE